MSDFFFLIGKDFLIEILIERFGIMMEEVFFFLEGYF